MFGGKIGDGDNYQPEVDFNFFLLIVRMLILALKSMSMC